MAEVTSNSTASNPCSSLKKKALEDTATDPFKSVGSLTFRIDNFREFSKRPSWKDSLRHCDSKVSVRGLTFGLTVYARRCFYVIVKCENTSDCDVKGDGSWRCLASVTLQIKSLLGSEEEKIYKFTHNFFSSKEESSLCVKKYPWELSDLLDPRRGLYNEKEDTLELILEISADTPIGIMELQKPEIIQVNEETVFINKNLLAAHSRYFHNMFYNEKYREGQSGEYKVKIEEPATVDHFKRMLQTMYPVNKPLDDRCIEGVLHLANQFLVTVVEGKCVQFLREKSTKSALFKYRMADKYTQPVFKEQVLENLKISDFDNQMFKANMAEYVQLGPDAAKTFMARYDKLFASRPEEVD